MSGPDDDPLDIDPPASGRVFGHRRRVQMGDGSPRGRARLDAVVRYLQDVSDEDTTDAGFPADEPWVVRRIDLRVTQFPVVREWIDVVTWGSGIGARWAERRVRIEGDHGGLVDAAVLWVHLDGSGRPARLPDRFEGIYGEAVAGRKVRARLHHDAPPDGAPTTTFPLRFVDFDVMGHVNNAVSWAPVEEALADRPELRAPLRASVEHPGPIDPGDDPDVVVNDADGGFDLWVTVSGTVRSSGRVRGV